MMEKVHELVKDLSRNEIELVMKAVENWFKAHYNDWDVVYMALPKEPEERKVRYASIFQRVMKDLEWNEKEYMKRLEGKK